MAVHLDLATYLKSRPTVSAIVAARVYENRAPQTTSQNKHLARIVYQLLSGSVRHYHSTGASGLAEAAIQLTLVASSSPNTMALYEAIRNEIDGFSGTWGTTTIDSARLSTPSDASGDPSQGDDTGYWAVRCVVEVFYQESIPTPVNP